MTSPEPVPAPSWPAAEMVTTEGRTSSATGVTGQDVAEPWPALPPAALSAVEVAADADAIRPPARPPTMTVPPISPHSHHRGCEPADL